MTNHPLDQPPNAAPAPAWYDDPEDPAGYRYWDGARWTDHRSPKHVAQPVTQAAAPTAQPVTQAASQTAPAATTDPSNWPLPRLLVALGAIAIVIGSVTTWASVSASFVSVDINGTEGDGMITVFGGIAILGLLFARKYFGGIIVGIVTGGILVTDLVDVSRIVDDEFASVSVGWGLYLATAGAVVAVVALIVLKRSERARARAE